MKTTYIMNHPTAGHGRAVGEQHGEQALPHRGLQPAHAHRHGRARRAAARGRAAPPHLQAEQLRGEDRGQHLPGQRLHRGRGRQPGAGDIVRVTGESINHPSATLN